MCFCYVGFHLVTDNIHRANSQQSVRIRVLETEAGHLLEENISLREQVIKLTVELDRRNRSTELLHIVTNTKSALEKKLREMLKLVGEMNLQPQTQGRGELIKALSREKIN